MKIKCILGPYLPDKIKNRLESPQTGPLEQPCCDQFVRVTETTNRAKQRIIDWTPVPEESTNQYLVRRLGQNAADSLFLSIDQLKPWQLAKRARHVDMLVGSQKWAKHATNILYFDETTITSRFNGISDLLGSTDWKQNQYALLGANLNTIEEKAKALTKLCGSDVWKTSPSLLCSAIETIQEHAKFLTELCGNENWKSTPILLGRSPKTLTKNAEELTRLLQSDCWKTSPTLLTRKPDMLNHRVEELKKLTQGNIPIRLVNCNPETVKANHEKLKTLVGHTKWPNSLLTRNAETLCDHANNLTRIFGGENWKRAPALLGSSPATLEKKVQFLTDLLGNDLWKSAPTLLARSSEVLLKNTKELTEILGNEAWKNNPALLIASPKTIRSNVYIVQSVLGLTPGQEMAFNVLTYSTQYIQDRLDLIQKHLFGKIIFANMPTSDTELAQLDIASHKNELVQLQSYVKNYPSNLSCPISRLNKKLAGLERKRSIIKK